MARSLIKLATKPQEDIKDFVWTSGTQITLPASSILIGTSGGLDDAQLYTASSLIMDTANGTADNGLDTGAWAAQGWYALYAVPSSISGQYILKATARHPETSPGPTGQTKWRYLGTFRIGSNVSATNDYQIARFNKKGKIIQFFEPDNVNQYGIRVLQSGVNATSVSTSSTQTTGTMSSTCYFPFAKTQYCINVGASIGTASNVFCELRCIARAAGSAFGGFGYLSLVWNNGFAGTNVYPQATAWWFVEGSTFDLQLYTPYAIASGNFGYRICVSGFIDPILGSRDN